jgi:hypothetical protein
MTLLLWTRFLVLGALAAAAAFALWAAASGRE